MYVTSLLEGAVGVDIVEEEEQPET